MAVQLSHALACSVPSQASRPQEAWACGAPALTDTEAPPALFITKQPPHDGSWNSPLAAMLKRAAPVRAALSVNAGLACAAGCAGVKRGFAWSCSKPVARSMTVRRHCGAPRFELPVAVT